MSFQSIEGLGVSDIVLQETEGEMRTNGVHWRWGERRRHCCCSCGSGSALVLGNIVASFEFHFGSTQ